MKFVVIHFNMMPRGFSVRLHCLIVNVPKQLLAVDQNCRLYSHRHDGSKSAIFSLHFWHISQLYWCFLMILILCHANSSTCVLSHSKTIFGPGCRSWLSYSLIRSIVIWCLGSRMIGCIVPGSRPSARWSHPPTRIKPSVFSILRWMWSKTTLDRYGFNFGRCIHLF